MKKLLIILPLWIVAACSDIENCEANDRLDFMVVRFFDLETKSTKRMGFTITADDSPFQFVPFTDSTGVGLPLDPERGSVTFHFDSVGTSVSYDLQVSYDTEISIFDPKCDPSFTFTNLDTVRQTFDSTVVVGTVTNRQLNTNVAIYF